jgi:Tfp pilus assembly protein PilF
MAALPRIRELQDEYLAAHQLQLELDASVVIADETAKSRQRLGRQLRTVLTIATVLAVFTVIGTLGYAYQQHLRREWLSSQYATALLCLNKQDYLCARNLLVAVLQEDPHYEDALEHLKLIRYQLAQQYLLNQQWQDSLAELDALLQEFPNDASALALMKNVYDSWYVDALKQGNLLTAVEIQLQRKARLVDEP